MTTMTADHAIALRAARDTDARLLSRKPKYELAAIERAELAVRGLTRICGGPGGRDELVSSILDQRYPRELLSEAGHVLYHKPGETWSACPWCGTE